jgi:hypothetical protein
MLSRAPWLTLIEASKPRRPGDQPLCDLLNRGAGVFTLLSWRGPDKSGGVVHLWVMSAYDVLQAAVDASLRADEVERALVTGEYLSILSSLKRSVQEAIFTPVASMAETVGKPSRTVTRWRASSSLNTSSRKGA